MNDILGRSLKFGDLIIAHNIKWTNSSFMGLRNYALYVDDYKCFTIVDDYSNYALYYLYEYKFDYCFLVHDLTTYENILLSKLVICYDNFKNGKNRCEKLSLE